MPAGAFYLWTLRYGDIAEASEFMQRKTIPLIGAMLAALAAIALAALVVWHQMSGGGGGARSNGEAVVAPGIEMGGAFELTGRSGEPVTDQAFHGQFMLIYFGYTSCPDICPTELSSMAAALDILDESNSAASQKVTPVFITIDPERDTVEIVEEYAAAFHPRMVGLTGDAETIDAVARKYRVFYSKGTLDEDGFYLMNHSGYVYLMGPDGEFVTMFTGGTDPANIAEALNRYVSEAL